MATTWAPTPINICTIYTEQPWRITSIVVNDYASFKFQLYLINNNKKFNLFVRIEDHEF